MIGDGATDMEACPPAVCIQERCCFTLAETFQQKLNKSIDIIRTRSSEKTVSLAISVSDYLKSVFYCWEETP